MDSTVRVANDKSGLQLNSITDYDDSLKVKREKRENNHNEYNTPKIKGIPDLSDINVDVLKETFDLFNSIGRDLTNTHNDLIQKVDLLQKNYKAELKDHHARNNGNDQIENQFDCLMEALPIGVVILGSTGYVHQCNSTAVELLGKPLMGLKWIDIISRSFEPKADDGHEVSLKDGRLVSISTRSFQEGHYQLIVINDLTETRQLQSRIEKNRRIWELGKMSAALAHQIRTPLSSAMLYTSQLNKYEFNGEKRANLCDQIMKSLQHLEAQVSDILSFVKSDESSWEWVSLKDLWVSVERSVAATLLAKGAKLSIVIENSSKKEYCPKIKCHRDALQGALVNIVQNGIEAAAAKKQKDLSGKKPEIKVVVSTEESMLLIKILDNGGGIPESIRNQVFDPFFSTKQYGTGLGLSVVKQVMDSHGFDIDIKVNEPEGTTFILSCAEFM